MSELYGTVVRVNGNRALVCTYSKESPCAGCKSPCHAGSCGKAKKVNMWVRDPIGAKPGERVVLSDADSSHTAFGALCFLLPLLAGAAAYCFLLPFGEGVAVGGCFGSFALLFVVTAAAVGRHFKRHPDRQIANIVSENNRLGELS